MRTISTHAAVAKAIRQFIKAKGLRASVRSESFAGGNAVDVDLYNAAPAARQEVETFAAQYKAGHFDGSTDCYEYSNRNASLPQVKFLSVSAHFDDATKQAAWDFLRGYIGEAKEMPAQYSALTHQRIWNHYATSIVYQFLMGSLTGLEQKSAAFWEPSVAKVSEAAFAKVWNNADDARYDMH
jgi:hypothetical protein